MGLTAEIIGRSLKGLGVEKPKKRKDRFIVRIVESPHTNYFVQFCTIPSRRNGKSKRRSFSPDTHPEFCEQMLGLVRDLYGPKEESSE